MKKVISGINTCPTVEGNCVSWENLTMPIITKLRLVVYYSTNFSTNGHRSKRRISPCIFQTFTSPPIEVLIFSLPCCIKSSSLTPTHAIFSNSNWLNANTAKHLYSSKQPQINSTRTRLLISVVNDSYSEVCYNLFRINSQGLKELQKNQNTDNLISDSSCDLCYSCMHLTLRQIW